jgi:peptide/nickel transport system substrate-binding protein
MNGKIKRREFLMLSSVAALGAVAAACSPSVQPTTAPAEPTKAPVQAEPTKAPVQAEPTKAPVEPAANGKEAPMLADLVKAGKLPPVDQRLPVNPPVVTERQSIGVYGGELRTTMFDPTWFTAYDLLFERMLVFSDKDGRTIVPNYAESFEVTPDGKTFTIHLRKGMKWSDGEPMTTEDVRFWWEDHMMNKEIISEPWAEFRFGGEPMKVEIIDDFTFKLTFAQPFGAFIVWLTRYTNDAFMFPSHYLKQFHAKYTDKAKLEAAAKAEKFDSWVTYYNAHFTPGIWGRGEHMIDMPMFSPWRPVSNPSEGVHILERNPYYWKVDTESNQLPYIDSLRFQYSANPENSKVMLIQNELDLLGQHEVTMAEYPFYKENESKANYIVGDYISTMGDRVTLFPQHTLVDDPSLTEIVRDPRWVKALSMAINREEINQSLFYGTARMGALSPMPASKYFKEEYGSAWAQFDQDKANTLLDEMGLKKGPNGMRTRPDGSPLKYNIENTGIRVGPVVPRFCEMVVSQWREVGIDATTKEIAEQLYSDRMRTGQVHVGVWHADGCTDYLLPIQIQWFLPTQNWGNGGPDAKWGEWYRAADRTAAGLVEPPDAIKKLYTTYEKMTSVVDEAESIKLAQEIFGSLAENPLAIGTVSECPAPLCLNKNLRNLPKAKAYIGYDTVGLSTYHPEAFYYEGGKRA